MGRKRSYPTAFRQQMVALVRSEFGNSIRNGVIPFTRFQSDQQPKNGRKNSLKNKDGHV